MTRIVRYGGEVHKCWLPGWWYRKTNKLKEFAVIECDCGRQYELRMWDGRMDWFQVWGVNNGTV